MGSRHRQETAVKRHCDAEKNMSGQTWSVGHGGGSGRAAGRQGESAFKKSSNFLTIMPPFKP
jgi:hypothetical protein